MQTGDLVFNEKWANLIGYTLDEIMPVSVDTWIKYVHPDDYEKSNEILDKHFNGELDFYQLECRMKHKSGDWIWILAQGTLISRDDEGKPLWMFGTHQDITERKQRSMIDDTRYYLTQCGSDRSLADFLEETLNELEKLTDSKIGFFHFVDDNQVTLHLQNWSRRTKNEFCKAEGLGMHYPISDAGVWVDCVREGKPVIHNDYQSLPHKQGLPDGHAPVIRELVVPVYRSGRMKAILGVGNKDTDYTQRDLDTVATLGDLAWDIVEHKRIELALKQSENRFRELFKHMSSGVAVYDVQNDGNDFIFKDINQNAEVMDHVKRSDLIGKNVVDVFPSVMDFGLLDVFKQVWQTGQPKEHPISFYEDDRISGWRQNRIYKLPSGELVAVFDDLTEKKQAEEEVKKLAEVVHQVPISIMITDMNARIIYVNPYFTKVSGYSFEESIGKVAPVLMRSQTDKATLDELLETLRSGRTWKGELESLNKNGDYLVESAVMHVLLNNDGKPKNILSVLEDITEHKKIEMALIGTQEQLLKAQEVAKLGHYVFDVKADQWHCSSELDNIFGIDEHFTKNKATWQQIVHPDFRDEMNAHLQNQVLGGHQPFDKEYKVIDQKTGEEKWIHGLGSLKFDDQNEPVELFGTIQDITSRKYLEIELKQLNENLHKQVLVEVEKVQVQERIIEQQKRFADMGQMINAIAHQWRQPLNNIHLIMQMVQDIQKGETYDITLEDLCDQHADLVSYMSKTIDDFRSYFSVKEKKEQFNIARSVIDTASLFRAQFNSHAILLNVYCRCAEHTDDCDMVTHGKYCKKNNDSYYGYLGKFRQVMTNLLTNAKDAILERDAKDRQIDIFVNVTPERFHVIVANTGSHLDNAVFTKIFEPYFTTKEEGKGTGIGLYMCKTIIEKEMDGEIYAKNTENGVEFHLSFPRAVS